MAQGQPGTDQRGEQCGGVAGADQGGAGGCGKTQAPKNQGMNSLTIFVAPRKWSDESGGDRAYQQYHEDEDGCFIVLKE